MSFLPKLNRGSFCSSGSEDSSSYSSSSYSDSSSSSSDSEDEIYTHKRYLPRVKQRLVKSSCILPKCFSNTNMKLIHKPQMKSKSNFLNTKTVQLRKSSNSLLSKNSLHENSFSSTSSRSSSSQDNGSSNEIENSNERNESEEESNEETEAVIQMSNMSFKVKDSPAKTEVNIKYPDKSELHVSWSNVKIREYKTSISSTSIPTNDSLPIGLSWSIVKEEEYKLDEYEEYKEKDPEYTDIKNYQRNGFIPPNERMRILNRIGTPPSLINFTVKNVNYTRKQRVESSIDNRRRVNISSNYTPIRIAPPAMSNVILHKAYNVFK